MARPRLVAATNTSPIIALTRIGQLPLLDRLFARLLMPLDVYAELEAKVDAPEPAALRELGNLDLVPRMPRPNIVGLHLGETQAIAVAQARPSTHFTYSEEEPNSLLVEEVPVFLAGVRRLFPQHFAMVALGFATGLRPSSLRPLRRRGSEADVLWDQGVVLVRRSHTRRDEVMEATKQKTRYRTTLPDDLMAILRWHVDRLPPGPMRDSDLLFPSETGGFRAASALDKPFRLVGEAVKLKKRVSSRAMRRTFQDLARNADIEAIVRQKICGYATQEMSELYSTIPQREIQAAVGAVISLAKYCELVQSSASWCESGEKGGKSETTTRETVPSGRNLVGVEGIEPSTSTV